jgi:Zinc finger, C3HC4 type (RING finger)
MWSPYMYVRRYLRASDDLRMCSPRRLSECGHVFCQGCLTSWFGSTRTQHVTSNPSYVPLPSHLQRALRGPFLDRNAFLQANLFLTQHPPPNYTCPTCRMPVTRKPVEDFTLKKVVSWVANVQGENPPKSTPPAFGGKKSGPWDVYFAS